MTFEQWQTTVPDAIKNDTVWRVEAYRLALFAADLAMVDGPKLLRDMRTRSHGDQLLRAAAAISSDIVEGYSRPTGKDRAKFYEYALGSSRESRDWYYKGKASLPKAVLDHRIDLHTQIIRLLITMVSRERRNNRRLVTPSINNQQSTVHV